MVYVVHTIMSHKLCVNSETHRNMARWIFGHKPTRTGQPPSKSMENSDFTSRIWSHPAEKRVVKTTL